MKGKEREGTGKRIPARHVSFPSDESFVLNINYWVRLLLPAKTKFLEEIQNKYTPRTSYKSIFF